MKALLADFGSTFTKVTLVDLEAPGIIATSQAPTTASTDLMEGCRQALEAFPPGLLSDITLKRACSSAAGGLRIAAIGLVPELTVKAAREAALGAGGRVVGSYAYTLTPGDLEEIRRSRPDLILLAGGSDGGDRKSLLENAALIAAAELPVPVIIAGNKVAAPAAAELLEGKVPRVVVAGNVMPEVNQLRPEPAKEAIRELYLEEITRARGIEKVQHLAGLAMPTPLAVMKAGELLQKKWQREVVLVDVGGATTDVHSFCHGRPRREGCVYRGLPEPFAKRTVEGDLGVRVSVLSLLETLGEERVAAFLPFPVTEEEVRRYAERVSVQRGSLPGNERERWLDRALAVSCIREALRRHSGRLNESFTPEGRVWIQEGKDLTGVEVMVGTGGSLVHSYDPAGILMEALNMGDPLCLTPRKPELYLDSGYVLSAIGLLAEVEPQLAAILLKETLAPIGGCAD